ncbi:hypothetical protein DSAG12_02258 [Promethearchaeum syntrophicum]|uniref:Uncharacterized protein n=1 Tax=Promethearchaeum syntrophicum TaxID=2594042 RepID=A0A5B9DB97_9ARCH|nr:hypothetical protein [Candidatus Prometheoarchaeum syntrophicum]QEE16428.1 hypothetical protein DSAG12_02258 [Candidatus Prometheoarchaeum syntrophicum]
MKLNRDWIRIKSKKKKIIDLSFSIGFLILIISSVSFLTELIEPQQLADKFNDISDISEKNEYYRYIHLFHSRSRNLNIMNDFDSNIDKIFYDDVNNYNFSQSSLFSYDLCNLNDTGAILVGLSTNLIEQIRSFTNDKNNSELYIINSQNDFLLNYTSDFNITVGDIISINVDNYKLLNISHFEVNFPLLYNFFFNGSSGYDFLSQDISTIIFSSMNFFYELWEDEVSNNPEFQFSFIGFQYLYSFSDFNDIIWSEDEIDNYSEFVRNVEEFFDNEYQDIDIFYIEDSKMINLFHQTSPILRICVSIIRVLQFLFILIPVGFLFRKINKYFETDFFYEANELLHGLPKIVRFRYYINELGLIYVLSEIIGCILVYVFILFQKLFFNIELYFNQQFFIVISLLSFICLILSIILNEFLLHKVLTSKIETPNLKNINKLIPFWLKIAGLIILIIIFILLNRLSNLLLIYSIIIGVITICIVVTYSISKLIRFYIKLKNNRNKIRKNKISTNFILFKQWNQFTPKKIFAFTLISCICTSIIIGSSITLDIVKNDAEWSIGSQISFKKYHNATDISNNLDSNSDIESYTSYISINTDFNTSSSVIQSSYNIMGINIDDWIRHYSKNRISSFLNYENDFNLSKDDVFISYKYKESGFDINDSFPLYFYNNTIHNIDFINFSVKALVKNWPIISSFPENLDSINTENQEFIILPLEQTKNILDQLNIEFYETFLLKVDDNNIGNIIKYISSLPNITEIRTVDLRYYESINDLAMNALKLIIQGGLLFVIIFLISDLKNNDINDSFKSKILGILGLKSDFRKNLGYNLMYECYLLLISLIISSGLLLFIFKIILTDGFSNFFEYSQTTLTKVIITQLSVSIFIIFSQFVSYLKFSKIEISKIFRHPE